MARPDINHTTTQYSINSSLSVTFLISSSVKILVERGRVRVERKQSAE